MRPVILSASVFLFALLMANGAVAHSPPNADELPKVSADESIAVTHEEVENTSAIDPDEVIRLGQEVNGSAQSKVGQRRLSFGLRASEESHAGNTIRFSSAAKGAESGDTPHAVQSTSTKAAESTSGETARDIVLDALGVSEDERSRENDNACWTETNADGSTRQGCRFLKTYSHK